MTGNQCHALKFTIKTSRLHLDFSFYIEMYFLLVKVNHCKPLIKGKRYICIQNILKYFENSFVFYKFWRGPKSCHLRRSSSMMLTFLETFQTYSNTLNNSCGQ